MKKVKIIFTLIIISVIFLLAFSFIDGYFSSRVDMYIKQKTILYTTNMLEDTIKEKVIPNVESSKIVDVVDNNVIINTKEVNNILYLVNLSLTEDIEYIKENGLKELSLPLGIIFSETLFNDSNPNIKINITSIGSVKTDVISTVEEYGINNSLFKVEIVATISLATLIPFNKQEVEVITKIPIYISTFQGEVPRYYSYGGSSFVPIVGE